MRSFFFLTRQYDSSCSTLVYRTHKTVDELAFFFLVVLTKYCREFACKGEPIHFSRYTEKNRFVIELDEQILRSKQIWSIDDEEYDSGCIRQQLKRRCQT